MASPEKIEEYLTATETKKNFESIISAMYGQMAQNALKRGDADTALAMKLINSVLHQISTAMVEETGKFWGSVMSDDEIDQMIAFYRHPVSAKVRQYTIMAQTNVMNMMSKFDFDDLMEKEWAKYNLVNEDPKGCLH